MRVPTTSARHTSRPTDSTAPVPTPRTAGGVFTVGMLNGGDVAWLDGQSGVVVVNVIPTHAWDWTGEVCVTYTDAHGVRGFTFTSGAREVDVTYRQPA